MTDAAIVQLEDALIAALNEQTFAIAFVAKRDYLVYLDRAELKGLRVAVAPASLTDEAGARGLAKEQTHIWLGMQQSVAPSDTAAIDLLILVQQQIRDFVRFNQIGNATWVKTEVPLIFLPEDIAQKCQFTAVLDFTFEEMRRP